MFAIFLLPVFIVELFIYEFNLYEFYRGLFFKYDPLMPLALSISTPLNAYYFIEISLDENKIIFKKPFWFMNRYFELKVNQIQEIKCYAGRGEFIDLIYLKDGKPKKKHFEFSTFRFKELQKLIDSLSAEIEKRE